jgi:hypothetical protein
MKTDEQCTKLLWIRHEGMVLSLSQEHKKDLTRVLLDIIFVIIVGNLS